MKTTSNPISGEGQTLPFLSLPLWAWAATQATAANSSQTLPSAVAYLMRRHRLPQTYAAIAALHSGLGGFQHD